MRRPDVPHAPPCKRCLLPPRWCICEEVRTLDCPLEIAVLAHHRELARSSSSGRLIARVFPEAKLTAWTARTPPAEKDVVNPEKDTWILHPRGGPLPEVLPPVERLQIILLDGSWKEAAVMTRRMNPWGRMVRLPMTGASRFPLRAQNGPSRYSTAEALIFLLDTLGLTETARQFRIQFELHVHANLLARGRPAAAATFLSSSGLTGGSPQD